MQALGCEGISKGQVSRICQELDAVVESFLDRPLDGLGHWPHRRQGGVRTYGEAVPPLAGRGRRQAHAPLQGAARRLSGAEGVGAVTVRLSVLGGFKSTDHEYLSIPCLLCTANVHGGRTIATKLFGTLGRSSWTHSHWPLGMSSIPDSGPICDGPEGRTEPATASTTSPTLSRSIPNSGCGTGCSISRGRPG